MIAGYLSGIHDVTGFVRITGTTSLVLENFVFNGQAPGENSSGLCSHTHMHYYAIYWLYNS